MAPFGGRQLAIYEIFSRRDKKPPDVFQYDDLPQAFRVQVVYIWRDAMGDDQTFDAARYWATIVETLAKELGLFELADSRRIQGDWNQCMHFLETASTEHALSLIEMSFRHLAPHIQRSSYPRSQSPANAIAELNARFKLHGIGYEFVNDKIIRIDSQYMHAESVKPALMLLKTSKFKGAEEEFIKAHEHYREGSYEDALTWALKSFESVMKTICVKRKIPCDQQKASANDLIKAIFENQVVPAYMQSEFSGLRAVLESGSPTLRNKSGGHGQGATPRDVPEHFAAYALHMAACNIVFLVECHQH